jgi:hypothetical protein
MSGAVSSRSAANVIGKNLRMNFLSQLIGREGAFNASALRSR